MKRIRFIAVIILLMGFSLACENEPDVPQCEKNKVGSITVKNETGYSGDFDVTWGDLSENYEKTIYNGGSYKYDNVPAAGHIESFGGKVELWVNLKVGSAWTGWLYNVEYLSPCEDMTYRWYLNSYKSTEIQVMLEISRNGVVIGDYPMSEMKSGGKKANL